MESPVYFPQLRIGDVCVDLCCGDRRVPQNRLHRPKIRAVPQQIRGHTVTQDVRMHAFAHDAGFHRVSLHEPLHGTCGEAREIPGALPARDTRKKGRFYDIASGLKPCRESLSRAIRKKRHAHFSSFPANREFPLPHVHRVNIQGHKLGNAQPGREKNLENRTIAE